MTTSNPYNPERIDQLMVDAATQGLDQLEQAELSAAIAQDRSLQAEAQAYELAATAAELAVSRLDINEPLPASLRDKLLASARSHTVNSSAGPALKIAGTGPASRDPEPNGLKWNDGRAFGWYAAAAAMIALVVTVIQTPQKQIVEVEKLVTKEVPVETIVEVPVETIVEVPVQPEPPASLSEQYVAMLAKDDTVTADWGFAGGDADPTYEKCTGEVIWNSGSQTGYMKLSGMPINNPTELQYQLWIVDVSRSTEIENTNRVDGGVFDVTAEGEVIIPIDAKLLARDAAVFAITAETPGGVVESKGPLQLVAVVEKG